MAYSGLTASGVQPEVVGFVHDHQVPAGRDGLLAPVGAAGEKADAGQDQLGGGEGILSGSLCSQARQRSSS